MGTIFTYNSYENRCVDIPNGSPLLKHIEAKEKQEEQKKQELKKKTKYDILIKELHNNKRKKNISSSYSSYTDSLCCREREGYGSSEFNRQYI